MLNIKNDTRIVYGLCPRTCGHTRFALKYYFGILYL